MQDRPRLLVGYVLAFALALAACGGRSYNLGDIPSDGDGGSGSGSRSGFGSGSGFGGPIDDAVADAGAGVDAGSACPADSTIACSGGAVGYACTTGTPRIDQPGLSCTSGDIVGYVVDYCCFPWPAGGVACQPLNDFPCGERSYAYECSPGATPPSSDATLTCGTNFAAPNGNNDFCCAKH